MPGIGVMNWSDCREGKTNRSTLRLGDNRRDRMAFRHERVQSMSRRSSEANTPGLDHPRLRDPETVESILEPKTDLSTWRFIRSFPQHHQPIKFRHSGISLAANRHDWETTVQVLTIVETFPNWKRSIGIVLRSKIATIMRTDC